MRVCIVDDAQFIRKILNDIFTSLGHQVVAEFSNAIDLINSVEKIAPDVITLDITMPEVDGITATQIIRRVLPQVKIVIISALSHPDVEKEAKRCGAYEFIRKPFSKHAIEQVLNKIQSEQNTENGAKL